MLKKIKVLKLCHFPYKTKVKNYNLDGRIFSIKLIKEFDLHERQIGLQS